MENELKVFYCPCADCEDCEYFISDNNGFYGACQLCFMGHDPEKDCELVAEQMAENG